MRNSKKGGAGGGPPGCRRGGRHGPAIRIGALSPAAQRGWVQIGALRLPCALGRSGCRVRKREGDWATPAGRYRLCRVLYRPDRVRRPRTRLPVAATRPQDGWCDAAGDPNYNRQVRHPYPASAERLWRGDALYDVVVVLDHNARPRVQGAGSAVFMHVARPGYPPTAGCVALSRRDLLLLLGQVGPQASLRIPPLAARNA